MLKELLVEQDNDSTLDNQLDNYDDDRESDTVDHEMNEINLVKRHTNKQMLMNHDGSISMEEQHRVRVSMQELKERNNLLFFDLFKMYKRKTIPGAK